MSSYPYSSLPANGENIRLLRLLPSEDEAAPLHCELQDYSLRRSTPRTHLYEALSYVWGNPDITLPIFVGKKRFQVTTNLHAALLCLRDHSLERIIWVDAICIDQSNQKERTNQVQLMARIYSSAHRVVVWLGDETVETRGALEDIQLAADEELIKQLKEEVKKQNIINLLQNPWFQRIWVLQEVAAARNVVIVCGSTTIEGYTFCLGVKSLRLSYSDSPKLQTLPSVIDIIERAGFRPKLIANLSERFSLKIRSLAELIDMFHTRQATDSRDKVFALLGMSSDDHEKAGLQPNYETSWEEILQQLVKFVLGKYLSVKTSSQTARIKCKGIILGRVSSVTRDNRQHVKIASKFDPGGLGDTIWTLQASANPIHEYDIICLLYGASKPSIIRLCKDHFAVVVIAATPLDRTSHVEWPQLFQSKTRLLRNLLLVWDWESSFGNIQDGREYKTLIKKFSQVSVFSKEESGRYLEKATRLWNDIAILDDLQEFDEADERLIAAQEYYYLAAFGKAPSAYESRNACGRSLLAFAAGKGHEDAVELLFETIHPDAKDGWGRTPLSWAAGNGQEAVVKLLLATGQVEADSKDDRGYTPLLRAAGNGHENVIKILVDTSQAEADSKDNQHRTPLSWAAGNGQEDVVKLLLAIGQVEADSKDRYERTPLFHAAGNGQENVVKLLLAIDQVKADSKDRYEQTPLLHAANYGHTAIVKLLLASGQVEADSKDGWGRTPLSWAAENGQENVVKILLAIGQVEADSKDRYERTPLFHAAYNSHTAIVKLLLASGQVEAESKHRLKETPLSCAVKNGHAAVVELLLATGQVKADLKDDDKRTLLSYAANSGHIAIVKLLLASKQVDVNSKDRWNMTPIFDAVFKGHTTIVELLLATGQIETDLEDYDKRTALYYATVNNDVAIVKLLESYAKNHTT